MKPFSGTWRLFKLYARLDRVKLTVWILGISGIIGASTASLADLYGGYEQQVQYALTTASSLVGRAFGGLVNGASLGSVTMVEMFNFTAVLIAFMSTLLVVRHTRKQEEVGASELIGAGTVGRYAQLSAAILLAVAANFFLCIFVWLLISSMDGISSLQALGFSASLACVGIAFAGIAGIGAQLSETGRGANSIAGGAIGVAFLLRAIGDGFGTVATDGLSASPLWVSWLSPLGWGYQIHPLTEQNWWLFSLLIGFLVVTVSGSFLMSRHRDIGLGILPSRAGKPHAKPNLRSLFGLTWRLNRGVVIGWSAIFIVLGIVVGGMANEFAAIIEGNTEAAEFFATVGSSQSLSDTFFGFMFSFCAVIASGFTLHALLKIREEEETGRLESLVPTGIGRTPWLASYLSLALFITAFLMVLLALVGGVIYAVASSSAIVDTVARLLAAAANHYPSMFAFAGFVFMVIVAFPRRASAIAWGSYVASLLVLQLAVALNLPSWFVNLSPFSHAPFAPVSYISFTTVCALLGSAFLFVLFGFYKFTSRDIASN